MTSELNSIDPTPEILTLSTGTQVSVSRVKTIQMLRLIKIFSAGDGIESLMFAYSNSDSEQDLAQKVLAVLVMAIPDAEAEVVGFLQSLVEPAHLRPRDSRQVADHEFNERAWKNLAKDLENPEIEDTVTILTAVIKRELPEFRSLGKRLMSLIQVAQPKTSSTTN